MTRLEQLQKLVAISPDDPLTHYAVGLEFIELKRWEDAVAAFRAAIRVDPHYSVAFYHLGRAQIGAADTAGAAETLRSGVDVARAKGDWKTEAEMRDLLDTLG